MKTLQDIEKRMAEIEKELETDGADLDALEKEIGELKEERKSITEKIEKRSSILKDINDGKVGAVVRTFEDKEIEPDDVLGSKEYRSAFYKSMLGKELTDAEKRAFTSAANSAGAVVPTVVSNEIIGKLKQIAPLLDEITLLRVKGNVTFATEGVRADAAQHTENAAITPSATDTVVSVTLGGYEFTKAISVSKTVQTMSIGAFEAWIVEMLTEDIARKIENGIVNGTGSSAPQGVEKANTWGDTNSITVAKASSITYANICDLIGLLPGGYDYNAKFLMSKKTLYSEVMKLRDDGKYPIVTKEGNNYTIMGYPVMLSDSVTASEMYFGDFKKIVGNLAEDINVSSSMHSGFLRNAIDFLGCALFDCKVAIGEAFVKMIKATS